MVREILIWPLFKAYFCIAKIMLKLMKYQILKPTFNKYKTKCVIDKHTVDMLAKLIIIKIQYPFPSDVLTIYLSLRVIRLIYLNN